jgi:glycosyltransferase involved in cell wall biosynthesis
VFDEGKAFVFTPLSGAILITVKMFLKGGMVRTKSSCDLGEAEEMDINMKTNDLIILTEQYPYGNAEPFLEQEINLLCEKYDKIRIIPLNADKLSKKREVPGNVEIFYLSISKTKFNRFLQGCWGFLNIFRNFEIFQSEMKRIRGSIYLKFLLLYQIISMEFTVYQVNRIFKYLNLSKDNKILIYSYWLYKEAYVAARIKKRYKDYSIKTISRAHGFDVYNERWKKNYIPLQEYSLKFIDRVFVCSENGVSYLVNKYQTHSMKFLLSRLGTDDYGVPPYVRDKQKYIIVSCSNIISVKRLGLLIEALNILNIKAPVYWHHFGDGELRSQIKENAKILKGKVRYFFHGHISHADLMNFYKNERVDLFINVSSSEGLPVSIMEAISFGIPVIATNVGGTAEIFGDRINEYLLEKECKARKIAELIGQLYNLEDTEYLKMRKNVRKIWEEKFAACENYKNFINAISSI